MLTIYGIAGKSYDIRQEVKLVDKNDFFLWAPFSINSISGGLSSTLFLGDSQATAQRLFLRAIEHSYSDTKE
jgi:hypothetical protein